MPKIFLVDDWPDTLALLSKELELAGFSVEGFHSGEAVLARLAEALPDLLLIDVNMPGKSGLDVLEELPAVAAGVPAVLMTGVEENLKDVAIHAIKLHAIDFIEKSRPFEVMLATLRRVLETREEKKHREYSSEEILHRYGFVASSAAMQRVCRFIDRIAPTDIPVLIVGETGTGKELVARAVHNLSRRKEAAFLAINCGAIVEALAESELFGHVKGAFTGAQMNRDGLFRLSEKGSLFLDEIAEASATLQVKLLRALDPGEYAPVGGLPGKVLSRIICSTNRPVQQDEAPSFRRDLFYRLEAGMIRVPPLRERRDDIPLLADYFLKHAHASDDPEAMRLVFTDDALDLLSRMRWKGNVRELRGFVGRLAVFTAGTAIEPSHIQALVRERSDRDDEPASSASLSEFILAHKTEILENGAEKFIEKLQAELYAQILEDTSGNKAEAARLLKIEASTFRKMLDRLGR